MKRGPAERENLRHETAGADRRSEPARPVRPGPPVEPARPAGQGLTESLDVPDSLAGLAPGELWPPEAYAPAVTLSGADKLSSSAVAPLVAAARGYRTLATADVKAAVTDFGFGPSSKQATQVRAIVGSGDAMVMPWFDAASVIEARTGEARAAAVGRASASRARRVMVQLRPNPGNARVDERTGRARKYEVISGSSTVIGLHPALPAEWVSSPARVFVTEGALKADAALTGLLRSLGVPEDELAHSDPQTAPGRLTAVLAAVEPEQRVLVLSLVGVGNWHNNPDWNSLNVKGRQVLVAFDGDVRSNLNVWRQADSLWRFLGERKGGLMRLVDIPADTVGSKLGVDDYLAQVGTWSTLLAGATGDLPARPTDGNAPKPGDLRVDDASCTVQKLRAVTDEFGQPTGTAWDTAYEIAGRVLSYGSSRYPTPVEARTGRLGAGVDPTRENVVEVTTAAVEVTWREPGADPQDPPQRAVVTGSSDLLAEDPNQWHRRGAVVPAALSAHPAWPPKPEWLAAVKAHRREDVQVRVTWERMGWVPSGAPGAPPVFVVGDQVVGADGEAPEQAASGVTDRVVARASGYGVHVPARAADGCYDLDEVRQAIRDVLTTYRGGVWTDRRVAAVVLAAALRPVVPIPPKATILFSGPPRKGKSWSAQAMMAFWQAEPGGFWDALPGSAADTLPATENAIGRTPIWVIDDLPPSADRRKAEMEQAKIGAFVRAVHNGTSRQKMSRDHTSKPAPDPISLLVVTAENLLTVSSEMDRVVHIPVADGFLAASTDPTDAVRALASTTHAPMTVTAACIEHVARQAARSGWQETVGWWRARQDASLTHASRHISQDDPNATRHSGVASSLVLGLEVLGQVMLEVGMEDEYDEHYGVLVGDLYSLVRDCFVDQKQATPGQRVLQALRAVLASGSGHLLAPGLGGLPMPGTDPTHGKDAAAVNQRLGWQVPAGKDDSPRALGSSVGYLVHDRRRGWFALLDPNAAFSAAQRGYPSLVPHGQSAGSTWTSAWSEGLAGGPWARKRQADGRERLVVRARGIDGIPVPLGVLLGTEHGDSDHDDEFES